MNDPCPPETTTARKATSAPPRSATDRRRRIRRRLLDWYRRHRRDLPWRHTRDPYAIWVSELMLQQTTVATATSYYERFIHTLPDVQALAHASIEEVLGLWSGLGYYRRARQLHAAARIVADRHGGALPADPEALSRLPGIGRYTSGAILSIAFDQPVPAVDGNVARVISRLEAIEGPPQRAATTRKLWEVAARLVPRSHPGDHNQALMELGARLCVPRRPDCLGCPLRGACLALRTGRVAELPAPRDRPTTLKVRMATVIAHRTARGSASVLLVRRPEGKAMEGLWETPTIEITEPGPLDLDAIRRRVEQLTGARLSSAEHAGHHRHAIMNRRIRLEVIASRLARPPAPVDAGRIALVAQARLDDYPLTGMTRKALAHLPG